jgi:hypothetical protein
MVRRVAWAVAVPVWVVGVVLIVLGKWDAGFALAFPAAIGVWLLLTTRMEDPSRLLQYPPPW